MRTRQMSKEDLLIILKSEDILSQSNVRGKLKILKSLISITNQDFNELYLKCINKVAYFLQQLPGLSTERKTSFGFLNDSVDKMLLSLKRRRSFMLPMGGDSEVCHREQDVWTYAVFSASLLQDCLIAQKCFLFYIHKDNQLTLWDRHQTFDLPLQAKYSYVELHSPNDTDRNTIITLVIKSLLPEKGLNWIRSYPNVYDCLVNFVEENEDTNILCEIVGKSTENEVGIAIENKGLNCKEVENNLNDDEKSNLSVGMNGVQVDSAQAKDLFSSDFILWIKNKVINSHINEPDSLIHNTDDGILLLPAILDQFLKEKNKNIHKEKLMRELFCEGLVIKNKASNHFIHQYYFGNWKDRKVIKGILVKGDPLTIKEIKLSKNMDLHRDIII